QRDWYALLARVQRESPDVFRSLLLEPDVAIWLGSREGNPGALGYIAAAAAILARVPARIVVSVKGGEFFLPGLGRISISARETDHAVVQVTSERVSVTVGDASIRLPRDLTRSADGWQPVRCMAAGKVVRVQARFAM